MTTDIQALVYSALLAWVMLVAASLIRTRSWTSAGFLLALGNRGNLTEPTPLAARADRAAKNMLENLVLFLLVLVAARLSGASGGKIDTGATIFLWARVLYFPVYLAGIPYLRTVLWTVGVVALAMIGSVGLSPPP